jgi:outer membrane protein assembly factor BamB
MRLTGYPRSLLTAIFFVLAASHRVTAEDWPQFRGPTGCGLSRDAELPLTWGGPKNENVLWTADLLGNGVSSPIVWKDRVFVMNASRKADDAKAGRKETEQYLACYDARNGERLWNTTVPLGPWKRDHTGRQGGGYASATPATDGRHVYALYGSSVLVAVNFQGDIVWRQELVPFDYDVEMATSPVLFEGTVIVFCGMRNGSRLVAFDREKGDVVWDKKLSDTGYGHNTPLIIGTKAAPQMILMGAGLGEAKNAIQSFDPRTGERLWWCAGRGETASPVLVNGLVFCDSGRGGMAKLLDPRGAGDITTTHVKWQANIPQGLGSPLVVGKFIYRLHDNLTFTCWEIESGKKVYQERVSELSSNWASPVADAAGHIFLASGGTSLVVEAGPEYKVLAVNKLNDPNHASPAIAGDRIYIAGEKRLYAVGKK